MTFEDRLAGLEDIVKQLENEKLPLDKAMELYKKGIELTSECRGELEEAKLTVKNMDMNGESTDE